MILVALPLPREFAQTVTQVEASQKRYYDLAHERRLVRRTYMGLLLLLTLAVLFVTTWLALFLSKLVTRPLSALAEATQEISRGRLDYRVDVSGADEIGDLVRSFNQMADELETSRVQIDASSRDLSAANAELDQRRRQMETILESIPTGVLSLDASRRVTHANQALLRMFQPEKPPDSASLIQRGALLTECFPAEVLEDLEPMLRSADRMGITTSQVEVQLPRLSLNMAVTAATLRHEERRSGYVVVFEDLSDLLKAQKQAAWREVARRVAHEIKIRSRLSLFPRNESSGIWNATALPIPHHSISSAPAPKPLQAQSKPCAGWSMSFRLSHASRPQTLIRQTSTRFSKMPSPCFREGLTAFNCTGRSALVCRKSWPTVKQSSALLPTW